MAAAKQKMLLQVDELFKELLALRRPERVVDKKKVKKKVLKVQEKDFFDDVDAWLKQVREFMQQSKLKWCELFNLRMQHCKDVLKADHIQAFDATMRWYGKQWSDPGKNPLADTVASFERFLATHTMDPDGCLVGMTPDASILSKFSFYLENQNQQINCDLETSQENLAKNIVAWSKIDDLNHLAREVRRMASILNSVRSVDIDLLRPGDLVVAALLGDDKEREGKRGIYYARFTGRREGDRIGVSVAPEERVEEMVNALSVFPFTEDMRALLVDVNKMERLVEDPTKSHSKDLNEKIKKRTLSYLAQQGIDMEIVERAQKLDVSIADLPQIQRTIALLQGLFQDSSSLGEDKKKEKEKEGDPFLTEIEEFARAETRSFTSQLGLRDMFLPTRERALKRLQSISWSDLPRVRVQRHLSSCKEALQHLQLAKRELMNGTTKDKTTEWWLSLIKDQCDKFLERRGFNPDVVPPDYLEKPPDSIQAVRDNLDLIREILNPNEDKHQVQRLIKRLKTEIYPEVDRFISHAEIVLAEQFNIPYETFSLDEAEARFAAERNTMNAEVRDWIEDMFKDIMYLKSMQRLEKPQKEKILDIVPVTGLIVGRFYRIENELRTVLDVWGDYFSEQEQEQQEQEQQRECEQFGAGGSNNNTISPSLSTIVQQQGHNNSAILNNNNTSEVTTDENGQGTASSIKSEVSGTPVGCLSDGPSPSLSESGVKPLRHSGPSSSSSTTTTSTSCGSASTTGLESSASTTAVAGEGITTDMTITSTRSSTVTLVLERERMETGFLRRSIPQSVRRLGVTLGSRVEDPTKRVDG